MATGRTATVDGNEAAASVAHRLSEVIAIYPITPSSPMGESSDDWSVKGQSNIWGQVPDVIEMQSEGGAAGAVHGSLQAGALTTTFTASQGLLLMIPNMYKIAGELTSYCMHVAARALATHALSIFGDHSDVYACRQTGFSLLASGSVQEAHDLAAIGTLASLRGRVPVLHFFDGFRTSHELNRIEKLTDDQLREMVDEQWLAAHRARAMTPDAPIIRGTAQNPDVFFQCREAANPFYDAMPGHVEATMDEFARVTGRQYKLFDYVGAPDAERVVVMMGSGAEVAHEAVDHLVAAGEKVGLIKVRLYRPFSAGHLLKAIPQSCKVLGVLDRAREPGAVGEPLYLDIVSSLVESSLNGSTPRVVGGCYGLGSKEFNPAMVKGVFDELGRDKPRNHFTVGIEDDVSHRSIPYDPDFDTEPDDVTRCVFFGLGADGTVGANKNSIKIIGEETDSVAQGYFVYDSKKSGAMTVSHLRFGPRTIRSSYLIRNANFVACHVFNFLAKYDVLDYAAPGAVFLLNSPYGPDVVWDHLPRQTQEQIIAKGLKFYCIDATQVAQAAGMGSRTNTIMQTCFFAISGVLPREEAIDKIKQAIRKTYGAKGEEIVQRNFEAVDAALENLHEVAVPDAVTAGEMKIKLVPDDAPAFIRDVTAPLLAGHGDRLPVSAMPIDGTWPVATTQYEKRNVATQIPVWDPGVCIQCNKCALMCPHAAIRAKVYEPDQLDGAPETFQSIDYKAKDYKGQKFTIQVAPEDCTGCRLCVEVCPAKNKQEPRLKAINMQPHVDHVDAERENYRFFLDLPDPDRTGIQRMDAKGSQWLRPLFEYSGACAGCGETPYVKLVSQLFGDRMLIANATGCSSIYGGNLPTTPYTTDPDGRGPTWSNSLFEDNAEFGFGMRLAVDASTSEARNLLKDLAGEIGDLAGAMLESKQDTEAEIIAQRARVRELREKLAGLETPQAKRLHRVADYLVRKSVWMFGGDGWAYDIGYGGLDHVFAQPRDVNILVMDTEVYSNTGGQSSKATPLGAVAKFAMGGKPVHKKDLGLMAMSYGTVYVASIAMGANENQAVKAFLEAESFPGPSVIIAYSHCIAHGYDLAYGAQQQKRAVDAGVWPLFRFDPRRVAEGQPPLQLDSKGPKLRVEEYMRNETRFRMLEKIDARKFAEYGAATQQHTAERVNLYQQLAQLTVSAGGEGADH